MELVAVSRCELCRIALCNLLVSQTVADTCVQLVESGQMLLRSVDVLGSLDGALQTGSPQAEVGALADCPIHVLGQTLGVLSSSR